MDHSFRPAKATHTHTHTKALVALRYPSTPTQGGHVQGWSDLGLRVWFSRSTCCWKNILAVSRSLTGVQTNGVLMHIFSTGASESETEDGLGAGAAPGGAGPLTEVPCLAHHALA